MNIKGVLRVAVVMLCASAPFVSPVSAAPVPGSSGVTSQATDIVNVRWRGGRHDGWRHHGWRHRHHHHGWGPAIGGLAAGAIIGGAIANSRAEAAETDAYCSQRFKSYDPSSGTYLGYDGHRHPCP